MREVLEFDERGNLAGLYTDEVTLYELGTLFGVQRAADVVFNAAEQRWDVVTPANATVASDKNRARAIEKERAILGPDGPLWTPCQG